MSGNLYRCILLLVIISAMIVPGSELAFAYPSAGTGKLETIQRPLSHDLKEKYPSHTDSGLPLVLYFYAPWCRYSLVNVTHILKAQRVYGTRVRFVCIDVEDPLSKAVIDKYQINPIPCAIYIDSRNEIIDYDIGFNEQYDLESRIQRLFLQDLAISNLR